MDGNVSLDRIRSELQKMGNSFPHVSTFYDFYGFKELAPNETKRSLEEKILNHVHSQIRGRLVPYVQMHEFEELLFSSPKAIAKILQEPNLVEWAEGVLVEFDHNPELIDNNSYETAPSKRLEKIAEYRKKVHGPNIAQQIGVDTLRSRCSGFNEWLAVIEVLS